MRTSESEASTSQHQPQPCKSCPPDTAQFPLLDPSHPYSCNTFDYTADGARGMPGVLDWIGVFRKSIPTYKEHALQDPSIADEAERQAAAKRFAEDYGGVLDALSADPSAPVPGHDTLVPINCYSLCQARERCLRNAGFQDIFRPVKAAENAQALALLPGLLAELDGVGDDTARMEVVLRGVFAGNIFDLGAAASAQLFAQQGSSSGAFIATRDGLLPRPWVVDDMDGLLEHLRSTRPYRQAIMFVDNAGSDVVLGMLPLARELGRRGTRVVIAANEVPAINDITAAEVKVVLTQAASLDPLLGKLTSSGQLVVVSSGTDMPVIDLSGPVSEELAAECAVGGPTDLIVLEGMGRAIETNLHARFRVDSLKLGMVKHPEVATLLGGRLYDCVCKFDRIQQS